jgi:hypothetical protein
MSCIGVRPKYMFIVLNFVVIFKGVKYKLIYQFPTVLHYCCACEDPSIMPLLSQIVYRDDIAAGVGDECQKLLETGTASLCFY